MWISRKKWNSLEKKIAALEKRYQEQQEVLNEIVESRDEELKQMKIAFKEIKENIQSEVIETIMRSACESKQIQKI